MGDSTSAVLPREHHAMLAHHFDDLAQQKEAATFGMWIFLATEVMLFGGIFLGYTAYRYHYYEGFAEASSRLSVRLGTINTVVLLASSLMMALAVRAAHHGRSRSIVRFLLLTLVLGAIFIGIKFTEYRIDFCEGLIPWLHWNPVEPFKDAPHAELFMVFYFIMTMLHAIHMTIGMGVLAVVAWFAHRRKFDAAYNNPVEISGLYWHFVDIVWVFLFPALYLISPRG